MLIYFFSTKQMGYLIFSSSHLASMASQLAFTVDFLAVQFELEG